MKKSFMSVSMFMLLSFVFVSFISGSAVSANEIKYVGAKRCKMCHKKQYKSWKGTAMFRVFELLKPGVRAEAKKKVGLDPDKDYTGTVKCLKCHTTGYGKPGGFINIAKTPKRAGVQCESCHGPGKKYMKMMMNNRDFVLEDAKKAGLLLGDESVCRQCHNESSPFYKGFNYAERLKKGVHKHYKLKRKH